MSETKYIVNFSTGLSSFEAARRTIEQKGAENTIVAFSDVKGDPERDPHAAPVGTNWDGEDEDNYRFLNDVERVLGVPIIRLQHPRGLGVWGAIFEARAITIRGQALQFAPCTTKLKMETMDAFSDNIRWPGRAKERAEWRKSYERKLAQARKKDVPQDEILKAMEHDEETIWSQPNPVTRVTGLGWLEDDRVAKFRSRVDADAWFPMTEKPFVDNCHIAAWLRERDVEPPASYSLGYPHANCGGACIKSGQQQWAALLKDNRGRYLYNETQEDLFRSEINSDVSILRCRKGGVTKELPLRQFREEVEAKTRTPEPFDWGGCGCFAPSPQMRMSELLLEVTA